MGQMSSKLTSENKSFTLTTKSWAAFRDDRKRWIDWSFNGKETTYVKPGYPQFQYVKLVKPGLRTSPGFSTPWLSY